MATIRVFFACAFLNAFPSGAASVELQWPVACEIGKTCAIQNYVDRDPGPGVKDYHCGRLTYDGHNGVDIRLATVKAQRAGSNVLAAAAGHVLRVRNDAEDGEAQRNGRASLKGRECGNGLVIAHNDGWETHYCHMAKGSLLVRAGEPVGVGQALGQIGMSGDTEFPHLHFTVRQAGRVIDPFAVNPNDESCNGAVQAWAPELRDKLIYRAGMVLNAGFSDGPVTMKDIDEGAELATITFKTPALVAFVRAIGLRRGDVQRLVLRAPDGRVLVERTVPALESDKAQVFLFAGIKRPTNGWATGSYQTVYSVIRDGANVIQQSFNLTL